MDTEPRQYELTRPGGTLSVSVHPGSGPVLVIVPGVMADAAAWAPVAAATGLEVHVLNRRGRAPSGPLGPGYSLDVELDDVRALLDSLPPGGHLFGWSYGGLAALEAAIGRDDLASVIAYEPVARPFAAAAVEPVRAAVAAGDLDRAVELINVDVSGFSPEHVAALRAGPGWARLRELAVPLGEELAALQRFVPRYDDYAGLRPPVTLLVGEHNLGGAEPYGPPFDRFRQAIPRASVVALPGAGHLAHVESPESLGRHVAAAVR